MDISYLLLLQSIREAAPGLAGLMNQVTNMGAGTIAIFISAIIFWSIHKKLGTRVYFAVVFGGVLNQFLKNIFCVNRPWIRDAKVIPDATAKTSATGYSFPSGHSQMGVSIYGNVFVFTKNTLLKIAMVLLMILIAFSRNFLGVHTPQDVIVGLCIGMLSVWLAIKVMDWAEQKQNDLLLLGGSLVAMAVYLLVLTIKPYPMEYMDGVLLVDPADMIQDVYKIAGMYIGFILGWFMERRFLKFETEGIGIVTRVLRSVFGIIGFIIMSKAIKGLEVVLPGYSFPLVQLVISFFFIMFIYPALFMLVEHGLKKVLRK